MNGSGLSEMGKTEGQTGLIRSSGHVNLILLIKRLNEMSYRQQSTELQCREEVKVSNVNLGRLLCKIIKKIRLDREGREAGTSSRHSDVLNIGQRNQQKKVFQDGSEKSCWMLLRGQIS